MEVICVNAKPISNKDGSISLGGGLIEGQIYEYIGVENGRNGELCYNIKGLGLKKCKRFKPVKNDWIDDILSRVIKAVEQEECVPV